MFSFPVAVLKELTVGLNDRRGSVERAKPRSKVQTGQNTFLGAITVKQFRIASPYGPVTVKLDKVRRVLYAPRALQVWIDRQANGGGPVGTEGGVL